MEKVGIIGGAGFIGSHNTKKFLEEGFQVKVSVTDLTNKDKYRHLLQLPHSENLEVVQLDVQDKSALDGFLQGCSIVIHGGTPFQLDIKDPKTELFDPTIKGTDNFLEAIKNTPGINKVIFIASVAAFNTNFPLPPGGKTPADTIGEEDEKFMSAESHPYGQAKFMANQTVEKFIREHPGLSFEIGSVSPVFVMGKSLSGREDSTSGGMQFLFKNKIAPNPFVQMIYDNDISFSVVNVTDVADAIFKVATTSGLHGKNYLLSSETYSVSDLSLMLNGQEPKHQPAIVYKNSLAKNELGIQFKPVAETLHGFADAQP